MTYGFDEIKLDEVPGGTVVTLVFKDKLKKEDYDHFVPQVEKIMSSRDKIRLLIELKNFSGFTPAAAWEDIKFGIRHFNDIEYLAIVGDRAWEKTMTKLITPFTSATVRYYDQADLQTAEQWIRTA